MTDAGPTPEQARAALAEAEGRAVAVRRSDGRLRHLLFGLAAMYLAVGIPLGFATRGGSAVPFVVSLAVFAVAVTLLVVLSRRVTALSRPGGRRFVVYGFGFGIWNLALLEVGLFSGWFGPLQPAWHFTVASVIAAIPCFVAAWLLAPRRR